MMPNISEAIPGKPDKSREKQKRQRLAREALKNGMPLTSLAEVRAALMLILEHLDLLPEEEAQ